MCESTNSIPNSYCCSWVQLRVYIFTYVINYNYVDNYNKFESQ